MIKSLQKMCVQHMVTMVIMLHALVNSGMAQLSHGTGIIELEVPSSVNNCGPGRPTFSLTASYQTIQTISTCDGLECPNLCEGSDTHLCTWGRRGVHMMFSLRKLSLDGSISTTGWVIHTSCFAEVSNSPSMSTPSWWLGERFAEHTPRSAFKHPSRGRSTYPTTGRASIEVTLSSNALTIESGDVFDIQLVLTNETYRTRIARSDRHQFVVRCHTSEPTRAPSNKPSTAMPTVKPTEVIIPTAPPTRIPSMTQPTVSPLPSHELCNLGHVDLASYLHASLQNHRAPNRGDSIEDWARDRRNDIVGLPLNQSILFPSEMNVRAFATQCNCECLRHSGCMSFILAKDGSLEDSAVAVCVLLSTPPVAPPVLPLELQCYNEEMNLCEERESVFSNNSGRCSCYDLCIFAGDCCDDYIPGCFAVPSIGIIEIDNSVQLSQPHICEEPVNGLCLSFEARDCVEGTTLPTLCPHLCGQCTPDVFQSIATIYVSVRVRFNLGASSAAGLQGEVLSEQGTFSVRAFLIGSSNGALEPSVSGAGVAELRFQFVFNPPPGQYTIFVELFDSTGVVGRSQGAFFQVLEWTEAPTAMPTTMHPTLAPTSHPSVAAPTTIPTTSNPSSSPSSKIPTTFPTTSIPTLFPSITPSFLPSRMPSISAPSSSPTNSPTPAAEISLTFVPSTVYKPTGVRQAELSVLVTYNAHFASQGASMNIIPIVDRLFVSLIGGANTSSVVAVLNGSEVNAFVQDGPGLLPRSGLNVVLHLLLLPGTPPGAGYTLRVALSPSNSSEIIAISSASVFEIVHDQTQAPTTLTPTGIPSALPSSQPTPSDPPTSLPTSSPSISAKLRFVDEQYNTTTFISAPTEEFFEPVIIQEESSSIKIAVAVEYDIGFPDTRAELYVEMGRRELNGVVHAVDEVQADVRWFVENRQLGFSGFVRSGMQAPQNLPSAGNASLFLELHDVEPGLYSIFVSLVSPISNRIEVVGLLQIMASPTAAPASHEPTYAPSFIPSVVPSVAPTTGTPTGHPSSPAPTLVPSRLPSGTTPTVVPTRIPTASPITPSLRIFFTSTTMIVANARRRTLTVSALYHTGSGRTSADLNLGVIGIIPVVRQADGILVALDRVDVTVITEEGRLAPTIEYDSVVAEVLTLPAGVLNGLPITGLPAFGQVDVEVTFLDSWIASARGTFTIELILKPVDFFNASVYDGSIAQSGSSRFSVVSSPTQAPTTLAPTTVPTSFPSTSPSLTPCNPRSPDVVPSIEASYLRPQFQDWADDDRDTIVGLPLNMSLIRSADQSTSLISFGLDCFCYCNRTLNCRSFEIAISFEHGIDEGAYICVMRSSDIRAPTLVSNGTECYSDIQNICGTEVGALVNDTFERCTCQERCFVTGDCCGNYFSGCLGSAHITLESVPAKVSRPLFEQYNIQVSALYDAAASADSELAVAAEFRGPDNTTYSVFLSSSTFDGSLPFGQFFTEITIAERDLPFTAGYQLRLILVDRDTNNAIAVSPTVDIEIVRWTLSPSSIPSAIPSAVPSFSPTVSVPSATPTGMPTSATPSMMPTVSGPSISPTVSPSASPSKLPSVSPSISPTNSPTNVPASLSCHWFPRVFPLPSTWVIEVDMASSPVQIQNLQQLITACELDNNGRDSTVSLTSSTLPQFGATTFINGYCNETNEVSQGFNRIVKRFNSNRFPSEEAGPFYCTETSGFVQIQELTDCTAAVNTLNEAYDRFFQFGGFDGCQITGSPSSGPSGIPTLSAPSTSPSISPTTTQPTSQPSRNPSQGPSSSSPTASPSQLPTMSPTVGPSKFPTLSPSVSPSQSPTQTPTEFPTKYPTYSPTDLNGISLLTCQNSSSLDIASLRVATNCERFVNALLEALELCYSHEDVAQLVSGNFSSVHIDCEILVGTGVTTPAKNLRGNCLMQFVDNPATLAINAMLNRVYPASTSSDIQCSVGSNFLHVPVSGCPTVAQRLNDIVHAVWSGSFICSTYAPSHSPTIAPTTSPTESVPSTSPTLSPTPLPSRTPSETPSTRPSLSPTTLLPTFSPSVRPSTSPSPQPTYQPSTLPTEHPSTNPTQYPTTAKPTVIPTTSQPTAIPTTNPSVSFPSIQPSSHPTTSVPSLVPSGSPFITISPSRIPSTETPTLLPTLKPITSDPTIAPTPCGFGTAVQRSLQSSYNQHINYEPVPGDAVVLFSARAIGGDTDLFEFASRCACDCEREATCASYRILADVERHTFPFRYECLSLTTEQDAAVDLLDSVSGVCGADSTYCHSGFGIFGENGNFCVCDQTCFFGRDCCDDFFWTCSPDLNPGAIVREAAQMSTVKPIGANTDRSLIVSSTTLIFVALAIATSLLALFSYRRLVRVRRAVATDPVLHIPQMIPSEVPFEDRWAVLTGTAQL